MCVESTPQFICLPDGKASQRKWNCVFLFVFACAFSSFTAGCSSLRKSDSVGFTSSQRDTAEVQRGRPNAVIDGVGWVAGIPNKLALWDRRADNHAVSPATESALVQYMGDNGLNDVLVRVNQYDPLGEWRRLVGNNRIHPGWRYTVGFYNNLEYTFLPGRILGGDWYNPFTDTLNVYSDLSPILLSRAAYAKDVRSRKYPGTYAAIQELPLAGLFHETLANQDVLNYTAHHGSESQRLETRQILYPDYSGSLGSQLASFVPFGAPVGRLIGAAVGHTASTIKGSYDGKANPSDCDER